jgi:tetratricopeptide (TPR) repeat protein
MHNMGACYYHLRRLDTALECIQRALEIAPDFEAGRGMLGKIQDEIGKA